MSSPSTTALDRGDKLAFYEKKGIREYWIVDLFARTIEIRELRPARRVRIYKEDQTFQSYLLPGLAVGVSDVFEAVP